MGRKIVKTRRDFLKASVGTAAIIATKKIGAAKQPLPDRKIINPAIDNLRVVCCHDPNMVTGTPANWNTIADQNEYAVVEQIQGNIDRMAMALAEKSTPGEAWETIFQKPATKEWPDVKVAIKVNAKTRSGIPKNNPRLAAIDKICKAINGLGVPMKSIIIYDGDDEEAGALYEEYIGNGLPAEVIVSRKNDALGGTMSTPVPAPWNRNVNCTRDIANGTIDILVNITVNKGSHDWTGPATISMKNHLGTFAPTHDFDLLVGITKSDAIVGGTPVRQQLCLVDSIFACRTGPSDPPSHAPHRLVMGTCSPVVDYLVIKKIREDVMNVSHTASIVNRYLSDFGYSPDDVSDFINGDPTPISPVNQSTGSEKKTILKLSLPKSISKAGVISFNLKSNVRPIFITIHNLKGRRIRSIPVSTSSSGKITASWDGNDASGARVGAGTYLVNITQNGKVISKKIELIQ